MECKQCEGRGYIEVFGAPVCSLCKGKGMEAPFNGLTNAEAERLALLLEELGEAQQVIGKILRHGYESFNPFDPDKVTNRTLLAKELGDVFAALTLMNGDLSKEVMTSQKHAKLAKVDKYLHHNEVDQKASK